MATNELHITFEGPRISEYGVSLDDLRKTLEHVQKAVRLMVGHLVGVDASRSRPPDLVREQSALRLVGTLRGSLHAQLTLSPPDDQVQLKHYGARALDCIVGWQPESDESLPTPVAVELRSIGENLSPEVHVVWLGDPSNGRRLKLPRAEREQLQHVAGEAAILYGWLKEVNWAQRTAQLHGYTSECVRLRFGAALNDEMLRLATRHVEVRGHGRFNKDDSWTTVQVQQISETRSGGEPFDLEAFQNNPNPKVFDPDKVVTIDLTDEEWESYNRAIREGRQP